MPAITIDAINNNKLYFAKGIAISSHKFQDFGDNKSINWKIFNVYSPISNPIILFKNIIQSEYYLCRGILWADIIIWQWDARIFLPHFWFLKFTNKKVFIEWVGSDIRKPSLLAKLNRFYKKEYELGNYTYLKESDFRSWFRQFKFKFLKAIPLLCPEMILYLDQNLHPKCIKTMQRINANKYLTTPFNEKLITIVHAPSAFGAKGTLHIRQIIKNLKKLIDFEYIEVNNLPRNETLKIISNCSIFLDQFILGSYGMAACEAMAYGKPVFCFLIKEVEDLLPISCPIVNCNLDTLESVLLQYLRNPDLRMKKGIESRNYIEKFHDSNVIVEPLMKELNK